jgi:hypothetical protein
MIRLFAELFGHYQHGGTAVPVFSPAVRFLFEEQADLIQSAARLRAQGVRFLLHTTQNPFNDGLLNNRLFFASLARTKPALIHGYVIVYDLYAAELNPPPASPP